ncbi:MAG: N-acetyl sugar amidotransferase [Bacteroidetes bacterium]|nr:N-acetyl sugar amidotransferase [Bacteroidota bacterium]MBK9353388.1 N-acetyl sugar amidotransferase [Bacteroidota bacterium]MBK9636159.1 N-acetyl sugar amidotransferase [Bacteroidota bacterium]MBL0078753.1 N-acetyl sugar amidotransferase [Bacteroidota bacterium]
MNKSIQICTNCVMDSHDDKLITFDSKGVCCHCQKYYKEEPFFVFKGKEGELKLAETIEKIKEDGKGKQYDVIMGLSGGVDSTYLALKCKEWGIRPLAVHFDNGWNSELAVKNIENIVRKLSLDLYTYVINWEEFRDLQIAYFKASVIDIEVPTDHAIFAAMYKLAGQNNIKYVMSGNNFVTESFLPESWIHNKFDEVNIKNIHKKYGSIPLTTFPFMDSKVRRYYIDIKGIKRVTPLNFLPYDKAEVKKEIQEKLDWKDYGGKHYESIFTRFYQGYILPTKFGVDKRKAHLSNLICSKQITKAEALEELKKPCYDNDQMLEDKEFVLKKLGFSEAYFEELMKMPPQDWRIFGEEKPLYKRFPILKIFLPLITRWRRYRNSV